MPRSPLGVLLTRGTHEDSHYALVVATAAAALGRPVTLFCTNGGCRLLLRDPPLLGEAREARLAERGVATLAELLEAAEALPLRLVACEAGLRAEGIAAGALRPGVEVAGIVTFLEAVGPGQIVTL
ncbi:DsrE family protein [Roseomonas sp. OT10]|uniref:DsrE family protein n=1 Tax=Roseomonas cutis TaxID=2897332 RepID=UPI001E554DA7|nr:DsrE family protein [Roseomonas sp. OT10]UFN50185.1 DsrE family protein [Roseomonas sp. OT10]